MMSGARPRIAGLIATLAVLAAAGLYFWEPWFHPVPVATLAGPGGVAAVHLAGGGVDVVRVNAGGRSRELLRVDGALGLGMRWEDGENLIVCLGAARVLSSRAEVTLDGQMVRLHPSDLPPAGCGQ